jgi:hypothetical protein
MSEQSVNTITQAIEHVVSQEKGSGGLLAGRTVVRLKDCKAGIDELAKLIQNQELDRDEVLWLSQLNAHNLQVVSEIKSHFSIKIKDFFLELFGYILASKAKKNVFEAVQTSLLEIQQKKLK